MGRSWLGEQRAHERFTGRASEESGRHQRSEDSVTRALFETEEACGLRARQPQPGILVILAADTLDPYIDCVACGTRAFYARHAPD